MLYSALEKALLHRLAESTGRAVDLAYASIVHQLGITHRFFQEGGFGDLRVVDFHEALKSFQSWPPQHFEGVGIEWRRVEHDARYADKHAYSVFRGTFPTLARSSAYDALPEESRTAHVLWVSPHHPAPGSPTVVHLAATGDHGFSRRQHLATPLVAHGIGSIALESPFYGVRKPAQQRGAKLRRVSDLLLLGKATIEESLFLLRWLSERGHSRLGVSGLSMGGVHASMVAALYPDQLALVPLLAPRSAAQSYCQGALFHATDWERLLRDSAQEGREAEIVAAIKSAATANEKMGAARISQEVLLNSSSSSSSSSSSGTNNNILPATTPATVTAEESAQQGHWAAVGRWMSEWGSSLEGHLGNIARLQKDSSSGSTKSTTTTPFTRSSTRERHAAAVMLLEAVLETFTDATRFPVPRRPDAAVLVAATEDAYVSPQSVIDLHRHLPGSEIRWIPGGHVSSFLLHQPTFRSAIKDSLDKL